MELQTDAELIRNTIYKTAAMMDELGKTAVTDKVAMVNLRSNQLACRAADRAIQIHGASVTPATSTSSTSTATTGGTASLRAPTSSSCVASRAGCSISDHREERLWEPRSVFWSVLYVWTVHMLSYCDERHSFGSPAPPHVHCSTLDIDRQELP